MLKYDPGTENIESVYCFAHIMQYSINAGLQIDRIKSILENCNNIVSHFKHSKIAYNAYRSAQNSVNFDALKRKLRQFVKIKLNSVFYMIDRLIEQQSSIIVVLCNRTLTSSQTSSGLEMTENNWQFLEELRY